MPGSSVAGQAAAWRRTGTCAAGAALGSFNVGAPDGAGAGFSTTTTRDPAGRGAPVRGAAPEHAPIRHTPASNAGTDRIVLTLRSERTGSQLPGAGRSDSDLDHVARRGKQHFGA